MTLETEQNLAAREHRVYAYCCCSRGDSRMGLGAQTPKRWPASKIYETILMLKGYTHFHIPVLINKQGG